MKKAISITLGAAAVLTVAQLYILGAKGGIGPLGFTCRNQIAAHPGNGEKYGFEMIAPMEESPLAGKKICVLGSSVVFGTGSQEWAVAEYFSRRFGCAVTKEAVSGTTLCDISAKSYVSRLKMLDRLEQYDLFICQLSTNDATRKCPLGEMGSLDCATVTGAMEFIIRYAAETWHCPIVFFTGSRYDSKAYDAMVNRLYDLKAKYGIGVLDLWNNSSFNNLSDANRELYMTDPIHPTKAGYRDWWGPEMEKQLCAYLEAYQER